MKRPPLIGGIVRRTPGDSKKKRITLAKNIFIS
jgi:hypothetical protein